MQYFFADAPMKKKFQKFCVGGGTSLIKKIFIQTLVEIIFRYHKNFI